MFIESYKFGRIVIQGQTYTRDVKILEGRVVPHWWRESGHRVVLGDIRDLLRTAPEVIVFGMGKPGLMRLDPDVRDYLQREEIETIEQPTAQAMETINSLVQSGRRMAAGIHLTC